MGIQGEAYIQQSQPEEGHRCRIRFDVALLEVAEPIDGEREEKTVVFDCAHRGVAVRF